MKVQVAPGICLNAVEVPKTVVKEINQPTNHILVVDCSGSMYDSLPMIRNQLKNKLPSLVKEGDTVSMVWFSSRGQHGRLADKVKVNDLDDLNRLNVAIERWLKPMSLTGFVEPLKDVLDLCASDSSGVYSLFFLTDGYDNQWSRKEIIDATASLKDSLSGAVFVEYGWCCNRALMSEMAEELGGNLVFCENFDAYEPVISSSLSKSFKSCKKVEVEVGHVISDIVWSVDTDTAPCTYKVDGGKVLVPESVDTVYFYSEQNGAPSLNMGDTNTLVALYQSLCLLSQRMQSKTIRNILAGLGDVKFFKKYANCFGKQNNTDFQLMALETAKNKSFFQDGHSSDLKVDENEFTILQLLFMLMNDNDNLFVPSQMNYRKMSRDTEVSVEDLTEEEQEEINKLTASAKNLQDLQAIQQKMQEIIANKPKKLEFKYIDSPGYPIANLTWNESRPNVSILVKMDGTVELPDYEFVKSGKVPKQFPTYIYRNYNIICDGIAHMDELPVKLSRATFDKLKEVKVVDGNWEIGKVYFLNIRNLPTINLSMIRQLSAKELFNLEYMMTHLKADQKVYKAFREQWFGKRESAGFKAQYGEEATTWLNEMGLTDYSGFSPKKKQKEATDFYMGIEMNVSIKGIASLPSFNEFNKKKVAGKNLTARELMLDEAYENCVNFAKTVEKDPDKDKKLKEFIETKEREAVTNTRKFIRKMAEIKFGVIVGQVWFSEFSSIEENTLTMNFNGTDYECKVELKDVEIKI